MRSIHHGGESREFKAQMSFRNVQHVMLDRHIDGLHSDHIELGDTLDSFTPPSCLQFRKRLPSQKMEFEEKLQEWFFRTDCFQ